jgi:hypothetical protein
MRTAIMLNLHQPHGKGEYRFILLTFICFRLQDAQTPPSPLVGKGGCSQGEMFWQAPACHLPFQPSEHPISSFSPCGKRGLGG